MAANATNPAGPDRIDAYVWRVTGVAALGSVMSILDTTIVNVALDTLGRDLHAPIARSQWVITGYLLALAVVIPASGWTARRFGARRIYIAALVLFTAGSALCGLAHSITVLVVFRVVQGVGGGMIGPIGQMMIAEAAGPKRMGRVMAVVGVATVLAPVVAPTLGGVILDHLAWQWIFYVNVPIGAVALLAAWHVLPNLVPRPAGRLDVLGAGLLAVGMPAVVYGLSEIGATGGFTSAKVIGPIVIGIGLVVVFVRHALRAERPLLDVRLYANGAFAAASLTTFAVGMALFGALILMPLYFQQVRHYNVLVTGLLVAPGAIGAVIAMPISGRLTDRIGGGRIALVGVLITSAGTVPLALMGAHTSLWVIGAAQVIRGLGIGLAFVPAMSAALAAVSPDQLSDASPQISVLQRVSAAIGTAILAVVLQRLHCGRRPPLDSRSAGRRVRHRLLVGLGHHPPCRLALRAAHPRGTPTAGGPGFETVSVDHRHLTQAA